MRYTSFRIQNFKGIKDTTIDLETALGVGVFAIVGLNESGKTTILEAIHSFSPDAGTRQLVGSPQDDLAYFKTWVPRHEFSSFSGTITVSATSRLNEDDIDAICDFAESENDLEIDPNSFGESVTVHKWVTFSNGDYLANGLSIDGDYSVKGHNQRKWRTPDEDQRKAVCWAVYNEMPDIAYFPTFIFDFPEKVYLTDRGSSKDRFYRRTFQDILDFDGKGYTIEKDIIRRVRSDQYLTGWSVFWSLWSANDDKDKIDHVIDRAGATATKVVFGKWNKIFHESVDDKRVLITCDVDEGEVKEPDGRLVKTEKHDVFIRFEIRDGTRKFPVKSRSQGFRWFFAFMLFTQFRSARSEARPVLFLLDEPASNLHAGAQQKLVDSFPEIARGENMLMYSTHSHYMVEPKWLEQTYVVTNRADAPSGSIVDDLSLEDESLDIQATKYRRFVDQHSGQTNYFQPILDRLQVVPSRFDLHKPSIVVEGKSDYYVLRYAAEVLKLAELPLIPGLGAGTFDALTSLHVGWNLNFLFLLDGDKQGEIERERYVKDYCLNPERLISLNDLVVGTVKIEHLLDAQAKAVVSNAMKLSGDPSKKQIAQFFQEALAAGHHHKLGKAFERNAASILKQLKSRLASASC